MIRIQIALLYYLTFISYSSTAQFTDRITEPSPFTTRLELFEKITHLNEVEISENQVKNMMIYNEFVIPSHFQYVEILIKIPKRKKEFNTLYEFNRKGQVLKITNCSKISEFTSSEDGKTQIDYSRDTSLTDFLYDSNNRLSEIKEYNSNTLGLSGGVLYTYNKKGQVIEIKSYQMAFGKPSYGLGYYYFYDKNNLQKRMVKYARDTTSYVYGSVNGKPFHMIQDQYFYYDQLNRLEYKEIITGFGNKRKDFGYDKNGELIFTNVSDSSGVIIGFDSLTLKGNSSVRTIRYNYADEVSVFKLYDDKLQNIKTKDLNGDILYKVKLQYNEKGLRRKLSFRMVSSSTNFSNSELEYSYNYWK